MRGCRANRHCVAAAYVLATHEKAMNTFFVVRVHPNIYLFFCDMMHGEEIVSRKQLPYDIIVFSFL